MKKVQVPVVGGIRKVIRTTPSNQVGTTIAEYGSGTITLAQLKAALGLVSQPAAPNTQSKNPAAALILGPGLTGGGPLVGNVPINLTSPIPAFVFEEGGGGGDGDPGPPGSPGPPGLTGPPGPVAGWFPEDGADGQDAIPGPQGPQGLVGPGGGPGPGVYILAEDGEDGWHAIPGSQGNPGTQGPPGPLYFNEEPEGEPLIAALPNPRRRVNKGANWYSNVGALTAGGCNVVFVSCPVAATIRLVKVVTSGGPGNAVLDIWKVPFGSFPPSSANSITASAKPTLSAAVTYLDTTLTGWTRNINEGDILAFVVQSITVFTQLEIILEIEQ